MKNKIILITLTLISMPGKASEPIKGTPTAAAAVVYPDGFTFNDHLTDGQLRAGHRQDWVDESDKLDAMLGTMRPIEESAAACPAVEEKASSDKDAPGRRGVHAMSAEEFEAAKNSYSTESGKRWLDRLRQIDATLAELDQPTAGQPTKK